MEMKENDVWMERGGGMMQVYIRTGQQRVVGTPQNTQRSLERMAWERDQGTRTTRTWGKWGSAGIPDTRVDWQ